ncbi:MAG: hypothetical protein WCS34_08595 [Bacteroidales bacterium]
MGFRLFVLRFTSKRFEAAWIGESFASILFSACAPCGIVLLKWRLNSVGEPFISCIKLPVAHLCGHIIKKPLSNFYLVLDYFKALSNKVNAIPITVDETNGIYRF